MAVLEQAKRKPNTLHLWKSKSGITPVQKQPEILTVGLLTSSSKNYPPIYKPLRWGSFRIFVFTGRSQNKNTYDPNIFFHGADESQSGHGNVPRDRDLFFHSYWMFPAQPLWITFSSSKSSITKALNHSNMIENQNHWFPMFLWIAWFASWTRSLDEKQTNKFGFEYSQNNIWYWRRKSLLK
jgi:hypothetical protein